MLSSIRLSFRCQNATRSLTNIYSCSKFCEFSSAAAANENKKISNENKKNSKQNEIIRNSAAAAAEPLIISDDCVTRLKRVAGQNEMLRIIVEGGGCSGFEYKFDLVDRSNPDDVLIEKNGAKIVIDDLSLEYVRGSTVDFVEDLIKSAFRIVKNPNAEQGCSCGASFALKTPKTG